MKVLLALAHYYRPEADSNIASTSETARDHRAAVIRQVIETWRGHLGRTSTLNVAERRYDPVEPAADTLDIVVLVRGGDHLLDRAYCEKLRVRPVQVKTDTPRMIPFAAHQLFADNLGSYDMFVYSEDDLRPIDGYLLSKIAGFAEAFGPKRLVMPNRYEWNRHGPDRKTYIDGRLRSDLIQRYLTQLPDEERLAQRIPGREIIYERAGNPHSGFFALTQEQMRYWAAQPHFLDYDCSFVRELESAATLGMLKTFPIYKSAARDMGWIEIEHLDSRYSSLDFPRPPRSF